MAKPSNIRWDGVLFVLDQHA